MKLNKLAMVTLLGTALSQYSFAQADPKGTIYLTLMTTLLMRQSM